MNEKTEQLLEKLADKIGTTTEYLWNVLITQAKYDAIISSIQMIFMFAFIFATIKIHLWLTKKLPKEEGKYYSRDGYDKYGEPAIIGMIFASILSAILILFFLSGFGDLISAIFNPEYWALNKILKSI